MTKVKSLLNGIGNQSITEKYYDDWALSYDKTLENWNYKTPIKAVDTLAKIKKKIRFNLDLACGTGMYAAELKKKFRAGSKKSLDRISEIYKGDK